MSNKETPDDRWSLLEQAATVLDEPFHRQTVETTLLAAAKCGRKMETELASLRLTDAEREAVELAYSRLTADTHYATIAATLRGLLERLK